ncbi:nitroreductase [Nocardia panacis]|uniref:Nitroreductase n=1 Tax=Nocardia panacis TaxID=2340916 RepID=A0A3A4KN15_9NOCA|nr:nitroreductase [Nocardia panacis]RJO70936.1 nitroreductase [Nocardia panacis]
MTLDIAAVRALEPDFRRAPSAHNTQPWVLTYRSDRVEIGWDPARSLPASDPTGRDLMLGLGAFVECCLIVCADAGLAMGFVPDPGDRRIGYLEPAAQPYETRYRTEDVRRRASHRGAYRPGHIDGFGVLADLAKSDGAQLRRLDCHEVRLLLRAADRELFAAPAAVRELREWLRLSPHHARYRCDGLTDAALSLNRIEATGLRTALAAYPTLRHAGLGRVLAAASNGPLAGDGDVIILQSGRDTVESGRTLLRLWLELTRRGYASHPLSQIIDDPTTRARLATRLGVEAPDRLLHIARVGQPVGSPVRSHRLGE